MADILVYHLVPGGTVGSNPQPNAQPWVINQNRNNSFPGTMVIDSIMVGNGGFVAQNFADTVLGTVSWRLQVTLGGGANSRAVLNIGGSGLGLGGFTRIPPMASIMSGGVTDAFIAPHARGFYMEGDVRIVPSIGAAAEIIFQFCPSMGPGSGLIGATNGFGLVYANSLANDNYWLVITDGATVIASADTGIPALDSVRRFLRVEWGWIAGGPKIRAIIDGVQVAELVGPFVLNTANRLGAFGQHVTVGPDKMQASGLNSLDCYVGAAAGLAMGYFIG